MMSVTATISSMHPEEELRGVLFDLGGLPPNSPGRNGRSKPPHFRQNVNLSAEAASLL
jgi:hypothetical protein